jgi:hypothetical protein
MIRSSEGVITAEHGKIVIIIMRKTSHRLQFAG